VNGIINIITKNSKDTQGLYVSLAAGNHLRNFYSWRYGGKIGNKVSYRVFGQYSKRDHTQMRTGEAFPDQWNLAHAGFQFDYEPTETTEVMVQGNMYTGEE